VKEEKEMKVQEAAVANLQEVVAEEEDNFYLKRIIYNYIIYVCLS
jgi:hypothetical protein